MANPPVDVVTLVESQTDAVAIPHVVRAANRRTVREITDLTLDIHLMIEEPERHIGAFMDAGGDIINVHVEACEHPHRVLGEIGRLGAKAGIALNPGTPLGAATGRAARCSRSRWSS